VTTTATSRVGELRLLLGLIKLTGVNVVTKVTSSLEAGAKVSRVVDVGGMTIAGQKFSYGPDGFTVAGSNTAVPDLGAATDALLNALGVKISVPKPVVTKDGATGKIEAEALNITLDTKALRSKLPDIPFLSDIVNSLPDLPGQANLLKGLLLSLNSFAPKLVVHLGYSATGATVVPNVDFPTDPGGTDGGGGTIPPIDGGDLGVPTEVPPVDAGQVPTVTTPIPQASGLELPGLGNVPLMLLLAGLAAAGLVGWWLRQAGLILFGAAGACSHGLKAGIPDLRKV
jgi:hypothetical protein